jgi:hypothetical protein
MRIYAWIIAALAIGILAIRFASVGAPIDVEPDPDGKLTFHGLGYQIRVSKVQYTGGIRYEDGSDAVFLSIDRREFGSPDQPTEPSRISCASDGKCTDSCAPTPNNKLPSCPDIVHGWYRIRIMPASKSWEYRETTVEPVGPGFRCGDDGHPEMEFCWDPTRYTPTQSIANVHDVPYAAIRQTSRRTWISKRQDADGLPSFYAHCSLLSCTRFIKYSGASVELEFPFSELKNWQRIEARLQRVAEKLIKPCLLEKC